MAFGICLSATPASAGPLEDGQAALEAGDYKTAMDLLRPLAVKGNAAAQYSLSRMYHNGWGTEASDVEAFKWASDAVTHGNMDAHNVLGVLNDIGSLRPVDHEKAVAHYRIAAENGLDKAQVNLGISYYWGTGLKPDFAMAFKWFYSAAVQGQPQARQWVAKMYGLGRGTAQDIAQSAKWYCWASGTPLSNQQLGLVYDLNPTSTAQNAAAIDCLHRAAEQRLYGAEVVLGYLSQHGLGMVQDKRRAAAHYRQGAEVEDLDAQYALAQMYRAGDGIAQDDAEAANWFQDAAQRGSAPAEIMLGTI